jgi:hypothetical protein
MDRETGARNAEAARISHFETSDRATWVAPTTQYLSEPPLALGIELTGGDAITPFSTRARPSGCCTLKACACLDGPGLPNSGEGRPYGSFGLANHKS